MQCLKKAMHLMLYAVVNSLIVKWRLTIRRLSHAMMFNAHWTMVGTAPGHWALWPRSIFNLRCWSISLASTSLDLLVNFSLGSSNYSSLFYSLTWKSQILAKIIFVLGLRVAQSSPISLPNYAPLLLIPSTEEIVPLCLHLQILMMFENTSVSAPLFWRKLFM